VIMHWRDWFSWLTPRTTRSSSNPPPPCASPELLAKERAAEQMHTGAFKALQSTRATLDKRSLEERLDEEDRIMRKALNGG